MPKKQMTFEQGLEQLRELVESMEQGELPLKETFDAYEQGRKLAIALQEMLDSAQKRLTMLSGDGSETDITGQMAEAEEDSDDNA